MSYIYYTYIANGREYYVYGESTGPLPSGVPPYREEIRTIKKDFLFSESLMRFLDLDYLKLDLICKQIDPAILALCREKDASYTKDILTGLDELAHEHIYFEFLRLDWRERLKNAEAKQFQDAQRLLPHKKISWIPSEVATQQQKILELLPLTMDLDKIRKRKETAIQRMDQFHFQKGELFSFEPLSKGFEQTANGFCETLHPKSIYDLVDYHLRENLLRDRKWRVCKNCGRYFPMTGRLSAEYCDRTVTASGSTCKDVGSTKTWEKKMVQEDETFQDYRREYKRRYAWIRLGKWTGEQFSAWSQLAQKKKTECDRGELSPAEFTRWLKES